MEVGSMAKQILTFQKSLFENAFTTIIAIQDHTEKVVGAFLNQIPWIPEEGKKTVISSIEYYKRARADFKKSVDEGFTKIEDLFGKK